MDSKKQRLRERINNATTLFLSQGGKVKEWEISTEVNHNTAPLADFLLMGNPQMQREYETHF